jgi:uncharacterized membrane protein YgcG
MEIGLIVFAFIIFLTFISMASAMSGESESEIRKKRVEEFMDDMRNKEFGVTVNIKGDLNGTMVLGDLTIKDSYNNIDQTNKVLAAAVANMGCHIKEATNNESLGKEVYPEFKKLVGYLSVGKITLIKSTWESFLTMYPTIKKDLIDYLIIEEYIVRIHSISASDGDSSDGDSSGGDSSGGDSSDSGSSDSGSSDGGSSGGSSCGDGCGG